MPADEPLLDDLADAVLDGTAIDWAAAESGAGAAQPFVRDLKLVASVAQLHREILPAEPDGRGQWGHLRLLESVGRGACGEVFRAWDTRLDREVALKLLPATPSKADDAAASALAGLLGDPRSIIREGRLLAKVRHSNVVTIHGAEQIGDQVGLWMEFIHGRTLEQLLERDAPFKTADVPTIGVELCRAVSAVHAAGLLHRDIKTHNVMRADDGRIILMDFDVGREFDDASPADVAGTPLYLAPELFQSQAATVQSDVYSVGVVLYRLVTGSYPVRGGSIRELRAAHTRGERTSVREAQPKIAAGLARVIDRAIDPAPERRPESAEALGASLVRLQRRERRKPAIYAAALLATLAIAGIASWALRAPSKPVVESAPPASPPSAATGPHLPPSPPASPPPVTLLTAPPASTTPVDTKPPGIAVLSAVARGRQIGVRPSVHVPPFTNASGRSEDAWLSTALAEMVLREFRGSEAFRWIPGAVALAKAQLGQALPTESSQTVRPIVPADVVVSGEYTVGRRPEELHVSVKIDDGMGSVTTMTVADAGPASDLVTLISRIGAKARAALGAPALTGDQASALAASQPANAAAARAYAEGLSKVASDWVESMEAAVAADPRFAPAYVALAEGWGFRREPEKLQAAFARALEHSVAIPFEERKLIEIRALGSTGVPSTGPPDAAATARQNARAEAREAIYRELYDRYPDTFLYGFEVARAQQRTRQYQEGMATIDVISRLPGAAQDLGLAQLEARLAGALRLFPRAQLAWDRMASIATSVGDRAMLAYARNSQALLAADTGEPEKALSYAEEALRHFGARRNRSQVFMVSQTIASVTRRQGGFTWARQTYEALIVSARQRADREAEGALQHSLASLMADHGDLSGARSTWEHVIQGWTAGDRPDGAAPLLGLGVVLLRQGDLNRAETTLREALAEAESRQDLYQQSLGQHALSTVLFEQGDLLEALLRADRGIEAARAFLFTPREHLARPLGARARVLRDQGDAEGAAKSLQEAAGITGTNSQIGRAARAAFETAVIRAQVALDEGRSSDARALAEPAIALARAGFRPDDEAAATGVMAVAWLAEGRLAEAEQAVTLVEQRLKVTQDRLLHLSGAIAVARVRAAAASTPTSATLAKQRLDGVSREAAGLGAIVISFEARLALGEIEIKGGDVSNGRVRLTTLERDATARGFLGIARKAAAARR